VPETGSRSGLRDLGPVQRLVFHPVLSHKDNDPRKLAYLVLSLCAKLCTRGRILRKCQEPVLPCTSWEWAEGVCGD